MIKKLLLILTIIGLMPILSYASGSPIPGPNSGQVTVNGTSSIITPAINPARYSITFLNNGSVTAYVCKATQKNTLALVTCTSTIADIVLTAGASFSTNPNGYSGQFTAITSSSSTTLIITED